MKYKISLLLVLVFSICYLTAKFFVHAELDCLNPASITSNDDRDYCIQEIDRLKGLYLPAQETNKKNLAQLQSQLTNLNKRIKAMLAQLDNFAKDINKEKKIWLILKKFLRKKHLIIINH